jgi:Ca2+-binding RTX toxin-like protein
VSRGYRRRSSFLALAVLALTAFVGPQPAAAATVTGDYRFQGSLASSVGTAPDLVDIGKGASDFADEDVHGDVRTVLRFSRGTGLSLSPAAGAIDSHEYTIEVLFRFRHLEGWRKIVDFKKGSDDSGLYTLSGHLNFYPEATAPAATVDVNTFAQVVLTRDASGVVVGYVDGMRQFRFRDTRDLAVIDAEDTLRFFKDDRLTNGNEYSGGAVSRIRLYDGPLTANEVSALACAEIPSTVCGTAGDDDITGTAADEVIIAGGGNDTVDGGGGNDVILGQGGDDVIVSTDGDDVLLGGPGMDSLSSGAGEDVLWGRGDADVLSGGGGRDRLHGDAGADVLNGGGSRDTCVGGNGRDEYLRCERERD